MEFRAVVEAFAHELFEALYVLRRFFRKEADDNSTKIGFENGNLSASSFGHLFRIPSGDLRGLNRIDGSGAGNSAGKRDVLIAFAAFLERFHDVQHVVGQSAGRAVGTIFAYRQGDIAHSDAARIVVIAERQRNAFEFATLSAQFDLSGKTVGIGAKQCAFGAVNRDGWLGGTVNVETGSDLHGGPVFEVHHANEMSRRFDFNHFSGLGLAGDRSRWEGDSS